LRLTAAINLTDETEGEEVSGSWSPDGNWFVYVVIRNSKAILMKVKTTGHAMPIALKADVAFAYGKPIWSPAGNWIACNQELISPDGKTTRSLGNNGNFRSMFSADGKLVYGIRSDGKRNILFSVDIATGAEKVLGDLGKDYSPATASNLSLAPDGKTFVYDVRKSKSNLWMLEGFEPKTGLLARFLRR
jgi:Tol biopolymer transport system component